MAEDYETVSFPYGELEFREEGGRCFIDLPDGTEQEYPAAAFAEFKELKVKFPDGRLTIDRPV